MDRSSWRAQLLVGAVADIRLREAAGTADDLDRHYLRQLLAEIRRRRRAMGNDTPA
jgi:hypothetical protein